MKNEYTSSGLRDQLLTLRGNPARIQQFMIRMLESMNDDKVIIMDATNPAIFCLESAAVMSCANTVDSESKLRRLYPSMANTPDELYLHMADQDYLGIYSTPSIANVTIMFDLEELLQKAIPESGLTGTRKITIPRYTKVLVADVPLTLLYPIDIRIMPHGGFNITFNTQEVSPIGRIETNLLDWFVEKLDGNRFLNIVAPFYQLEITSHVASLNAMSGFSKEYAFDDLYYYARAYIQNKSGVWTEIKTTMSDLVYNKEEPTVLLRLLNQSLKVTVPQIYLNKGSITDSVKIHIYTTKGPLNINLQNYIPRSYIHDWSPVENTITDRFSKPLTTLATVGMYSSDIISGGTKGITFNELKEVVTSRSTVTEGLPINEKQLTRSVKDLGYSIVKNIDNITDRQYLATKALPAPDNKFIVTNMGVSIAQLESTFLKLKELNTVTSSLYRLTIKPKTLYRLTDGILSVLPSVQSDALNALKYSNPSQLVDLLNKDNLLYSPYYYVFDIKSTEILPRIYDMDSPQIRSRYFFQDNPSIGISLGIGSYAIANSPDNDGYILEVHLNAGEVAKSLGPDHINVQLSYVGRDEPTRYFINGYLVSDIDPDTQKPYDDLYVYRFHIETRYDIDAADGLVPIPYRSPINLTHEFDIVTCIKDYTPEGEIEISDVDSILRADQFNDYDPKSKYMGVSQSKVNIKFGTRLERLWTKTRTVVDTRQLMKYDKDVPAYYKKDVYELDANGNIKISYNPDDNIITSKKLHQAGDLIYDPTGEQVFDHRKGDTILDEQGEPIYVNSGDGLKRQIDLFLIDALYGFANTNNVIEYKNQCTNLISQWVTRDMKLIAAQLLDRSEIFYYPPVSIGEVDIVADDGKEVSVDSRQSIKVKVYLTQINYRNASLREALTKSITESIQWSLSKRTISIDAVLQRLRSTLGDNVISFEVLGILNDEYKTATIKNDTMTLTLGKRALILPNLTIDIVDDITVDFYPHGLD